MCRGLTNAPRNFVRGPSWRHMGHCARLCQFLGRRVEEARPNIDTEALAGAFQTLFCSAIAYSVDGEGKRRGRSVSGCYARLPRSGWSAASPRGRPTIWII
jgi:hypothetical protein